MNAKRKCFLVEGQSIHLYEEHIHDYTNNIIYRTTATE